MDNAAAASAIFPTPRLIETLDGPGVALDAGVREVVDASFPAQGYELRVHNGEITLVGADDAGLRYGRHTLAQVRRWSLEHDGSEISAVMVRDHPDFSSRGYMLDVSRDRVPTMATLERLVELLALARYNELQLYMEHTFAYTGHEVVWRDASPFTAEEIRRLDTLCADAGIELVANQNTFGHMGRWLAHDAYRDRAHTPGGFELIPGMNSPPGVLAPTPENAEFVHGLLAELLANFTSRRVNIGCDETFELDDTAAYTEHLMRIAEPLLAQGYEVQFWADVIRREPARARALAPGMVPIVWNYESPRPGEGWPDLGAATNAALERLGITAEFVAGFDTHVAPIAPLATGGHEYRVAPGTSSWNSLVGRLDNALANLADAASSGLAHGATGYLVTDWGDNGHLQAPPVSFAPLLVGGALSWCAATNDVDVVTLLQRHVAEVGDDAELVVELGTLWDRTGQWSVNASPLQAALCPGQVHLVLGEPDARSVREVTEVLHTAVDTLSDPSLANAARLARHGAWRLTRRAGGEAPRKSKLRRDLTEAIADYEECWAAWSRPGGLPDSRAQLEATLADYS